MHYETRVCEMKMVLNMFATKKTRSVIANTLCIVLCNSFIERRNHIYCTKQHDTFVKMYDYGNSFCVSPNSHLPEITHIER